MFETRSGCLGAHRLRAAVHLAFLGALAAALFGCAVVSPRPEPPTVALRAISIERIGPDDARLTVVLDLDNPNDRDVALDALDFTLKFVGATVASGRLSQPLRLPARGRSRAEVGTTTPSAALFAAMRAAADASTDARGERSFAYEIAGTAVVDGVPLPFARRGQKNVADWLGGRR